MKNCIVNFSDERFSKGQQRLAESLKDKFDGDVLLFKHQSEIGGNTHSQTPYAFKIHAIKTALELGYTKILWLDASVYAVKDVNSIFDKITENEIFFEEAGHWVGSWSNDYCLNYFNITREEAMKMPMYSAGFSGFDFSTDLAKYFFKHWENSMLAGCFNGSWQNHRHDMTCGSIIANLIKLTHLYQPCGTFFSYVGEGYSQPNSSSIFHLRGL